MAECLLKAMLTALVVAGIGGGLYALALLREEEPGSYIAQVILALIVAMIVVAMYLMVRPADALARDADGRYAQSPLKPWFDKLKSGKGLCCSYADGVVIEDSDWDRTGDGKHYRVRVPDKLTPGDPMVWVDVVDDAVITEPNRAGKTMVWPMYGTDGVTIRCFMPGSMS